MTRIPARKKRIPEGTAGGGGGGVIRGRAGFTLVEVLASIVILAILMVFVGRIFNESTRAFRSGMRSAEGLSDARALMEFMARELSSAIVTSNTTMSINKGGSPNYGTWTSDGVYFVTLSHQPRYQSSGFPGNNTRAVREVSYYTTQQTASELGDTVEWYELMRTERITVNAMRSYRDPLWYNNFPGGEPLAQYISRFEIDAYELDASGNPVSVSGQLTELPVFADLYLSTLSKDDVRRAAPLTGAARTQFIERNERRFRTRVYFMNRTGYTVVP